MCVQGRVLRDAVNVRVSGDELTVSPTMPAATSLQLKDIGKQGTWSRSNARQYKFICTRWCYYLAISYCPSRPLLVVDPGLEALRAEHSFAVVSSCEEAYSIINADTALHEYGPSFQLIQVCTQTINTADALALRHSTQRLYEPFLL